MPVDESRGTKEIYTSMHQLWEFFEEEKNYVEDIKTIIEKKLVTQSSVTGLGEIYFNFQPISTYFIIAKSLCRKLSCIL